MSTPKITGIFDFGKTGGLTRGCDLVSIVGDNP
jgi:hypothetical protein